MHKPHHDIQDPRAARNAAHKIGRAPKDRNLGVEDIELVPLGSIDENSEFSEGGGQGSGGPGSAGGGSVVSGGTM